MSPKVNKPIRSNLSSKVGGWIFVVNSSNLPSPLAIGSSMNCFVQTDKNLMRPGQTVFLWSPGTGPGIIARGTIETPVFSLGEDNFGDANIINGGAMIGSWTVLIKIVSTFPKSIGPQSIIGVPGLRKLSILKNPHGTNYSISPEEEALLKSFTTNPTLVTGSSSPPEKLPRLSMNISKDFLTAMVNALDIKRNIIIEGCPGVGKTRTASELAAAVAGTNSRREIWRVQFHQSFGYEDFVQGWRPNAAGGFSIYPGIFMRLCSLASINPGQKFVLIVEEINRGNISKIFGELFTLLEKDKRGKENSISLSSVHESDYSSEESENQFFVPDNLYIIGTMNSSDRSTAIVDYALRRRFRFFQIEPAFGDEWFKHMLQKNGLTGEMSNRICSVMQQLNDEIRATAGRITNASLIGHSYFCISLAPGVQEKEWLREIVDTEIKPLLAEYWPHDRRKVDRWTDALLA